ncbi:MAG: hypothetical protein EXS16_01510 [Gemmataceae bacterium]|nr:hypothetical protein [Gemmataceae bacterium]
MSTISVFPTSSIDGVRYSAVANNKCGEGASVGSAIDALTPQLDRESTTVVLIQNRMPDDFFTAAQQVRLESLMSQWRSCRDSGVAFSAFDQAELETLIEAEIEASAKRTASVADEMKR